MSGELAITESKRRPRLVLASTSLYRKRQLERLGLEFETLAPRCDEDALKSEAQDPRSLAVMLAQAKALSLSQDCSDGLLIGGDQVVEVSLKDTLRICENSYDDEIDADS